MKLLVRLLFLLCVAPLAGSAAPDQEQLPNGSKRWAQSIVTVEVARKQYDYYQPWSKRTRRVQKAGIVIAQNQVLTTADELFERTLVRLQKFGRGRWYVGEVAWIDYHANLALLTTSEQDFWQDLQPAQLGSLPDNANLQLVRWREGNLEVRRAEFLQFTVREGQISTLNHVVMEISSEIQGVGWGEPVVADGLVTGLLTSQDGRTCSALPASFIKGVLQSQAANTFKGLGYFHWFWQPAINTALLERLKLPGDPRGVLVIDVPPRPDGADLVLKREDIILKVDGFDIDIEGDYLDPEFGHLLLENLATRAKAAGDIVKLLVWRGGEEIEVSYRLPKHDYTNALVPMATYDREPEYVIVGGLVFQPLTDQYLQSWGAEWKRRAPFRLAYYREQQKTKDQKALVLLSQVLPDPYNTGYQEIRWLVLDQVNGQKINTLADVNAALKKVDSGFHLLEFTEGDSLRRIVISAGKEETEATSRVLSRYNIDQSFHLESN